jgi:hypothetical protein
LLSAGAVIALPCAIAAGSSPTRAILSGAVMSGRLGSSGAAVTLYATGAGRGPSVLGRAVTRRNGTFTLAYDPRLRRGAVTYVLARRGGVVRLATALGASRLPRRIVVNERTTVAAGFALAQFISRGGISGKSPGLQNASAMVRDLVDPRTGQLSRVLSVAPNGNQTSTMREVNSLANMAVGCARSDCARLERLARPRGGSLPAGGLDAFADIARNPGHNVGRLFSLARAGATPYRPALRPTERPDAWTLALRFFGDGRTMNGPGNMAIDARGNVWATDNYTFSRDPTAQVCGGKFLLEFNPTGQYVRGSPFTGGGAAGAGFGITLDPRGNVWIGNFGFEAENCAHKSSHDSVSEFTSRGKPLSPSGGFTQGDVQWPQGTVADRQGNIWMANCANNTVTRYAGGNPNHNSSIPMQIAKPFDIAFNTRGQAFVTGNASNAVEMLGADGRPALPSPITGAGLNKPLGVGADIEGNMWVANSGFADVPCPTGGLPRPNHPSSLTLISSNGRQPQPREITGGGLTAPWGVAVDGHDNVWVANFSGQRLSEFCGKRPSQCPHGTRTGQPISPSTGYGFDGLVRNTGVQIDPSGNVWVANNWKSLPLPHLNPGGYQIVAFIGLAGPIRTPLIGPPRPL